MQSLRQYGIWGCMVIPQFYVASRPVLFTGLREINSEAEVWTGLAEMQCDCCAITLQPR